MDEHGFCECGSHVHMLREMVRFALALGSLGCLWYYWPRKSAGDGD